MLRRIWFGVVVSCGVAAGCSEPETITSYKVPKLAPVPDSVKKAVVEYRLLGAIIPGEGNQSWFLLMQGKSADLNPQAEAFDAFLKDLKFPNGLGKEPVWTLPKGWAEDKSKQMRIATFYPNGADKGLEISMTKFGGDLLGNVNRWRKKVGMEEVDEAELKQAVEEFKTATGQPGFRVDAKGRKDPTAGGMPGMGMPRPGGM